MRCIPIKTVIERQPLIEEALGLVAGGANLVMQRTKRVSKDRQAFDGTLRLVAGHDPRRDHDCADTHQDQRAASSCVGAALTA